MNRLATTAAAASFATVMTACVSPDVADYAGSERTFRLEEYFLGKTTAYGVFEDRFGKVRRQFRVDITGTLDGDVLTLDEQFYYDDGERDTRVWEIDILADGVYRGTAGDVPGTAEGVAQGNAFNWTYKVDLPVNGSNWRVRFNDWMFLMDDNVVLNRAFVKRFGIEIGSVTIAFTKDG